MEKLIDIINKNGIENIIFLAPMRPLHKVFGLIAYTSSTDKQIVVPAKIDESRFKVKDEYKITLKSIYEQFGKEHFYVSDLEHLIKDGIIKFYVAKNLNNE